VRFSGGRTKLGWGVAAPDPDLDLSTAALDRIVEHNAGDLTAILEAGVPLARAQDRFAQAGQMLALDPPLGGDEAATVGGVVATGDSGPLRHRYGGARDLVVGVTVALSDGTLAKAGGKVIKNVAGYDLAKLFAGSFGTLGLIVELAVRLHPRPERTATALGSSGDPALLAAGASAVAHSQLELQGLDVRWEGGRGTVLARSGGAAPRPTAEAALRVLSEAGLVVELADDDAGLWARQRSGQRSDEGLVVRVSGTQSQLDTLLRAAERVGGSVVGRGGLGISWVRLEGRGPDAAAASLEELRHALAPSPCVVLDAPAGVRERVDVWGPLDRPALELMRRVKQRFDPAGSCNPGLYVGGI
jgi:glycolate oxidase FAD binding subunit